ncbi:hypothetical protein [Micromonospora pallida]|uniref:hypothetical protein n=1 Tax=Micromonospora pallida TaxID=145854 RepID=UPI000B87B322|nr:hypothetical protein [Micromonospora pallida]
MEIGVYFLPSVDWSAPARDGSDHRLRSVGGSAAFRLPAGCTILVTERQARMLRRAGTLMRLHFAMLPIALLLFAGNQFVLASDGSGGWVVAAVASATMLLLYPVVALWLRRLGMPYLRGDTVVLPDVDTVLAEELARRHPGYVRVSR